MKYYGYLLLVLVTLISSVLVENENIFKSSFFIIAYIAMSFVIVIGSKYEESFAADVFLGIMLIFAVAFLSTETLIKIITGQVSGTVFFKIEVIVSLDYCALGFLRLGKEMRDIQKARSEGRYTIYGNE